MTDFWEDPYVWDYYDIDDESREKAALRWCPEPPAKEVSLWLAWANALPLHRTDRRRVVAMRTLELIGTLPRWPVQAGFEGRRAVMAPELIAASEAWRGSEGNLLLLGPTGKGKTTALVHALFESWRRGIQGRRFWPEAVFARALDIGNARRFQKLGEGEAPLLTEAKETPLLVLDDMGLERRDENAVFDVLDFRNQKNLTTLVSSGFPLSELVTMYGDALIRRIVETGTRGRIVDLFGKPRAATEQRSRKPAALTS